MKHYFLFFTFFLTALIANAQHALSDSEVTMDGSGTITNCTYSFAQTDIVIPDTLQGQAVRGIGNGVFAYKGITSISMDSVTSIGGSAFTYNMLTSISLPNVTSIMDSAFMDNQLTSINLPKVTSIGEEAFAFNQLTSISLPKVTFIGMAAFSYNMLGSVSLASVTNISVNAFMGNSDFYCNIYEHTDPDFICFKSSANQYFTFGDTLVDTDVSYQAHYGISEIACESYTSPGGNVWTESGFYEEFYLETDSVVMIYLTVDYPVGVEAQITDVIVCLGSPAILSVTTIGSASSYQWMKEGILISGATNSVYSIPVTGLSDEGFFSCEVDNMCDDPVVSEPAELKVIELILDVGLDNGVCINNDIQMQASSNSNHSSESGTINYSWFPESSLDNINIPNPIASPIITTSYYVFATDENSCQSFDSIEVYVQHVYQEQQICLVTVDPTTGKNKMVWEANEDVGTASYLIKKALSSNVYSTIGIVDAGEASEFIDLGSDPASHSDFYKISVVDTCGNVSDIDNSVYHKTINLTLSNVGSTMSLNWEQYEVEDGSYVPATYKIFRGADASNMVEIDEINGMLSSYNDLEVYQVYHYMIVSVREDCGSNRNKSVNTGYEIFSNQKNNEELITGLLEKSTYLPITLYPNPASTEIFLENLEITGNDNIVRITDVSGKVVKEFLYENSENRIQINDLFSGTYFLTITGNKIYRSKFVKY